MALREKINKNIKKLPAHSQAEVLDFVEFLVDKTKKETSADQENKDWSNLSLSFAMRGMEEDEEPHYTSEDIKERFK